jgi:hypothetical protein
VSPQVRLRQLAKPASHLIYVGYSLPNANPDHERLCSPLSIDGSPRTCVPHLDLPAFIEANKVVWISMIEARSLVSRASRGRGTTDRRGPADWNWRIEYLSGDNRANAKPAVRRVRCVRQTVCQGRPSRCLARQRGTRVEMNGPLRLTVSCPLHRRGDGPMLMLLLEATTRSGL